MARTTILISDDLAVAGLGASARIVDSAYPLTSSIEIRIGDETIKVHVPTNQAHSIAAAISADLLAVLPVVCGV